VTVAVTTCDAPIASRESEEAEREIAVATGGAAESLHATANKALVARKTNRFMIVLKKTRE
jgi:hypothetical protein